MFFIDALAFLEPIGKKGCSILILSKELFFPARVLSNQELDLANADVQLCPDYPNFLIFS